MNQKTARVAGIILAAGASTRMGKTKQLLSVCGETLLGRVIDSALNADLDKVVLVLGHDAKRIKASLNRKLENPKLEIVENPLYKKGISSSIIAGLSRVEQSHDHVMILLGDMPHAGTHLINLLLRRYLTSLMPIGAIQIEDRAVHPVMFSREIYPELRRLQGDVGARDLFRKYSHRVCLVRPEKSYDPRDIDTPEDYAAFQASFRPPHADSI